MDTIQVARGNRIKLLVAMIAGLAIIMSFPSVTINPLSAQEIIPKIGNRCPNHYAPDGNYCKPLPGAKEVIRKIGNRCPKGFASDGDYCYRIERKPSKVMPKAGSRCPTGFVSDGDYCISLN
jgi:hypothetical protein